MTQRKFNIGDRVRVISKTVSSYRMRVERVKEVYTADRYIIRIEGDGSGRDCDNCLVAGRTKEATVGDYFAPRDLIHSDRTNHKFRVGDIVIGNKKANHYNWTIEGWKGKVMSIKSENIIFVRALEGSSPTYDVMASRFDLFKELKAKPKKKLSDAKIYLSFLSKMSGASIIKYKKEIKIREENIESLEGQIKENLRKIGSNKASITTARREIRKEKPKELPTEKLLKEEISQLKKHSQIVGIDFTETSLIAYTLPLKVKGKQFGHFEIKIPLDVSSIDNIKINNLQMVSELGSDSLDHWAVQRGIPCWGEWAKGIQTCYGRGNLYLLVDTIIKFLLSSEDGDAYCKVPDWFEHSKKLKR